MAGKFRVKANRVRSSRQAVSVRRNAFQINEPAPFETAAGVPEAPGIFLLVFLLGRWVVNTDNENSQNSGFSGRITIAEKADSRDDARR
jgi:hypothetical protein